MTVEFVREVLHEGHGVMNLPDDLQVQDIDSMDILWPVMVVGRIYNGL